MAQLRSQRRNRLRRPLSEINVVPYIDIMLVLLIIFMVTAPLVSPSLIQLPTVSQAQAQQTDLPLIVNIEKDQSLSLKYQNMQGTSTQEAISLNELRPFILNRQANHPNEPVVIAADKEIPYQKVMDVMSMLQKIGVKRVGLLVRTSS